MRRTPVSIRQPAFALRNGRENMAAIAKPATDRKPSAGTASARPAESFIIEDIGTADLKQAIRLGWEDFRAMPSHLIFLAAIYPAGAFLLGQLTSGYDLLPMFFPLVAGFALLGPFAALGLYEISRRREMGAVPQWSDVLDLWRSPSRGAILALGVVLLAIFGVWMVTANWLYDRIMGDAGPTSITGFLQSILTTEAGWTLIVVGHAVGLVFAALAFVISVVSFPLLLDRPVGVGEAISASVATVRRNPVTMAIWAAIIAGGLMAGSALLFVGLVVVLPVLAHASWHLYRRTVRWV
jgi:uncharacterized membrane protein